MRDVRCVTCGGVTMGQTHPPQKVMHTGRHSGRRASRCKLECYCWFTPIRKEMRCLPRRELVSKTPCRRAQGRPVPLGEQSGAGASPALAQERAGALKFPLVKRERQPQDRICAAELWLGRLQKQLLGEIGKQSQPQACMSYCFKWRDTAKLQLEAPMAA